MKIAIGSDHAGFPRKKALVSDLMKQGHKILDVGCFTEESCDYPDFALAVAKAVSRRRAEKGILVCGSGIGMGIAANKVKGIRAAVCWSVPSAHLAAEHNGANVLCLSGRFLSASLIRRMIYEWLHTPFGGGRHQRRVDRISKMEGKK